MEEFENLSSVRFLIKHVICDLHFNQNTKQDLQNEIYRTRKRPS